MGGVTQGQRAGDRFGEGEPERCSRVTAAQPRAVEALALEFQRAQTPGADGFSMRASLFPWSRIVQIAFPGVKFSLMLVPLPTSIRSERKTRLTPRACNS